MAEFGTSKERSASDRLQPTADEVREVIDFQCGSFENPVRIEHCKRTDTEPLLESADKLAQCRVNTKDHSGMLDPCSRLGQAFFRVRRADWLARGQDLKVDYRAKNGDQPMPEMSLAQLSDYLKRKYPELLIETKFEGHSLHVQRNLGSKIDANAQPVADRLQQLRQDLEAANWSVRVILGDVLTVREPE